MCRLRPHQSWRLGRVRRILERRPFGRRATFALTAVPRNHTRAWSSSDFLCTKYGRGRTRWLMMTKLTQSVEQVPGPGNPLLNECLLRASCFLAITSISSTDVLMAVSLQLCWADSGCESTTPQIISKTSTKLFSEAETFTTRTCPCEASGKSGATNLRTL